MVYRNFVYSNYVGHFPFLINYPERITNYDIPIFNGVYQEIEDFFEKDIKKGMIISSINSLNTGCLLIPIALKYGITYCNALDLVTREQKDAESLSLINATSLIIDEVGVEDSRVRWIIEKIINHRFKGGYQTIFGISTHWDNLDKSYTPNTASKIVAMSSLRLNLSKSLFVVAANEDYRYDLEKDY